VSSKYDRVYSLICGGGSHTNILHFQWLAVYRLHSDLRIKLKSLNGKILDVGCGGMPYASWIPEPKQMLGIDESPGPKVDLVVKPEVPWALGDREFDGILCTQVLEHAESTEFIVRECFRCLKSGGQAVFTVPFIYGEHGSPKDYFRFSAPGIASALSRSGFELVSQAKQGGIGSTLGLLLLGWVDEVIGRSSISINLRKILFPIWILFSLKINILGWIMDQLDLTQKFYSNVMMVVKKP